jgi:hypothetical protein
MPYYNVQITTQYTTAKGQQKQSTSYADLVSGMTFPFEFSCDKNGTPILYRAQSFDFTIKIYGSVYHMVSLDIMPEEEVEEYESNSLSESLEHTRQECWRKEQTDSRIASTAENHRARFSRMAGTCLEETSEFLIRDGLLFPFHDFLDEQFTYEILQQSQYFHFILAVDGKVYELETIAPADDAPDVCPYL